MDSALITDYWLCKLKQWKIGITEFDAIFSLLMECDIQLVWSIGLTCNGVLISDSYCNMNAMLLYPSAYMDPMHIISDMTNLCIRIVQVP